MEKLTDRGFEIACKQAYAIGREHGKNAASWIDVDSDDVARNILRGFEDGDPEFYDSLPKHGMSGEWADSYTMENLIEELELDRDGLDIECEKEDLFAEYDNGYNEGLEDALVWRCKNYLED